MKKIIKYIVHPSKLRERLFVEKARGKKGSKISDEVYISKVFKFKFKREINLNNPISFNEKLQWLKLHDRNPFYTDLCDKIKVKEIVAKELGEQSVLPNLGIWDNAKDIDWDKLPNKFVLKCNHDCGSVVVCRDKASLDKKRVKKSLKKHQKYNYYSGLREWPYKNIERKIFAEQYIESEDGSSIVDYKFFCFNGEPKFLYVSEGMDDHRTARMSFFDLNGKKLPFKRSDYMSLELFKQPNNFTELKIVASRLAKKALAKFIRVDLYTVNGNIYFSEFTFFPCGGFLPFEPPSADEALGNLLKLS